MPKALILCGGYGSRLGNLTKDIPKPLIEIAGKPLLQHIVDRLNIHGITKIIVKVHYLPNQIMKVLGDRVIYYYEPALFSHFETLNRLKQWLDEDFFVINGDTITDLNYTEMSLFHKEKTITEFVDEYRCAGTWFYSKEYFSEELVIRPYRPKATWFDIGTPEKLMKAKEYFEA